MNELKPCPFCGGDAAISGNGMYVYCKDCGCKSPYVTTGPRFVIAAWNRRAQPATLTPEQRARLISSGPNAGRVRKDAQPAAPACECAACKPNTIEDQRMILCSICGNKRCPHATDHRHACTNSNEYGQPGSVFGGIAPADAAPSVAPEPVAWTTLIEIDWVKRNAGRAGSFYAVKAGPNDIPLFAHPPRAPLTEEHVTAAVRSVCPNLAETSKAWRDLVVECRYWLEAAHGIGGK